MSLIIATGSNVGDRFKHLEIALQELKKYFNFIHASDVFSSQAVDYTGQPDFLNQLLEFEVPNRTPLEVMDILLNIEKEHGRVRDIDKGPRTLDIDLIFWGLDKIEISDKLIVPHPRWSERSFVVYPLLQLPFVTTLEKHFTIPKIFNVKAFPIEK